MAELSEIREVSYATGMSVGEIRSGMESIGTDDPTLGAGYAAGAGLAVRIKGDRHQWNVDYAHGMRGRILELVEKYRTEGEL